MAISAVAIERLEFHTTNFPLLPYADALKVTT